jgi:hypothetical protein
MGSSPEYHSDLFIDRPDPLRELNEWIDTALASRVKPVVGPPGSGKTWILKTLELGWKTSRYVLWLDVPQWINSSSGGDPLDIKAAHQQLEEAWEKAKSFCNFPKTIDHTRDLSAIIASLVEIVCDCNLAHDPVVIVDGYDEITEDQAKTFSKRVLEPFISRSCIRMIIAYRDEWTLQGDALRRNLATPPLRIGTVDKSFSIQQFKRLYPDIPLTDEQLDSWMNQFQHYNWNIPLINDILFAIGFQGNLSTPRTLDDQNIYDCFKEAIERPDSKGVPRYEKLDRQQFELIYQIAKQLPDEWSSTAVEQHFEMSSSFYRDPHILRFFGLGLIVSSDIIHQIAPGLRELLREITDLHDISRY